jgi:hypothetical protein
MRTSLIALTLLACTATASAQTDAAPLRSCATWGTADSAGVLKWDTRWTAVDGREGLGALTFVIAPNGDLSGIWADSSAPSAIWGTQARLNGATIRGTWGAAVGAPAGTFLLRRWAVPALGEDGVLYCSFDGEYRIKGDSKRYTWTGWRRAD